MVWVLYFCFFGIPINIQKDSFLDHADTFWSGYARATGFYENKANITVITVGKAVDKAILS
ncbi:hypothetical protein NERG_01302 [Nematocida ausubeli]|uniref:Uncharacterized protein n=1 Tax=Nematocida ausubeli (strain ATCC PRA-371 / ERTm2) TaxID=1913371 RepID=H8ZC59_NEMA1|nr:hypothetical protein NERG_01302 [Nematocida ausubeli]